MDFKLLLDARDVLEMSRLIVSQRVEELERVHSHYGFWSLDIPERKTISEINEVLSRINKKLEEM